MRLRVYRIHYGPACAFKCMMICPELPGGVLRPDGSWLVLDMHLWVAWQHRLRERGRCRWGRCLCPGGI